MQRSVLLGEFDFTLDVKNRVAIPARLRAVFAGGVYLTRGFDRCLAAFPPEEWDRFVADQTGDLPAMSEKGREVRRFLFAAATFDEIWDRAAWAKYRKQMEEGADAAADQLSHQ
jgi:MraZ protein